MSPLRLALRLTNQTLRPRLLRRMLPGWTGLAIVGGFLHTILDFEAIADALGHPAVALSFPLLLAVLSQRGLAAVFSGPHLAWLSRQPLSPLTRAISLTPVLLESGAPLLLGALLSHTPVRLLLLWSAMWCPLAWAAANLPTLPMVRLPRPRRPLTALLFIDLTCLLRLEARTLATLPLAALAAGWFLKQLADKGALTGEGIAEGAVALLVLSAAPAVGVMARLAGRLGPWLDPARFPISPMLRASSLMLVAGLAASPAMAAVSLTAPTGRIPLTGLALAAGLAMITAGRQIDAGRYGVLALLCGVLGVLWPVLLLPVALGALLFAARRLEVRR